MAQWDNLPRDPVLSQWSALDLLPDTLNTSRWSTCCSLQGPITLLHFFLSSIKAIWYMLWDKGQLVKLSMRLANSLTGLSTCVQNLMLVWKQLSNDRPATTSAQKNLARHCGVRMKSNGMFCCWWEFYTNSSLLRPHKGSWLITFFFFADVSVACVQKELIVNMSCKWQTGSLQIGKSKSALAVGSFSIMHVGRWAPQHPPQTTWQSRLWLWALTHRGLTVVRQTNGDTCDTLTTL